jgi:hypothetical protein
MTWISTNDCVKMNRKKQSLLRENEKLRTDFEAAKKAIAGLIPYRQLYFARNPQAPPLDPLPIAEVANEITLHFPATDACGGGTLDDGTPITVDAKGGNKW